MYSLSLYTVQTGVTNMAGRENQNEVGKKERDQLAVCYLRLISCIRAHAEMERWGKQLDNSGVVEENLLLSFSQ